MSKYEITVSLYENPFGVCKEEDPLLTGHYVLLLDLQSNVF